MQEIINERGRTSATYLGLKTCSEDPRKETRRKKGQPKLR